MDAPNGQPGLPKGMLGTHEVGRLIIGANQFTGYPHAQPLVYAKELFARYFTEEKIVETLAIGWEHGINTHITLTNATCVQYLDRFEREVGARIQWIAQTEWFKPTDDVRETVEGHIKLAADNGAVACFLQGGAADGLVREDNLAAMQHYFDTIRNHGMLAGLGGHLNETIDVPIQAGVTPDFVFKTLNTIGWSCTEPEKTVEMMAGIDLPWIAFKVLGAGRIEPEKGFRHAIESGADFLNVGMFDFQVAPNVELFLRLTEDTVKA